MSDKIVMPKCAITQIKTAGGVNPRVIGLMQLPDVMPVGYRSSTTAEFEKHLSDIAMVHGLELDKGDGATVVDTVLGDVELSGESKEIYDELVSDQKGEKVKKKNSSEL